MNRKKISTKNPTKKKHRTSDPIPWRYGFLTILCGLVLVVGFFFAARQHFSSIDFSIKNSKLKKQIDELETDKRRMQLAKEIALTPGEIKKAAKKIGLTEMTASNAEVSRASIEKQEKPQLEKSENAKPKQVALGKSGDIKTTEKNAEKEEKRTPEVKSEKEKSPVKLAKK